MVDALNALDEAGERPVDADGFAVYISGKSFYISGSDITENTERWKRRRK